jgi:hypothetical protein
MIRRTRKDSASIYIDTDTMQKDEKINPNITVRKTKSLHRPKRKMRQNIVMICIFYNYVSSNLLNVPF